MTKLSEENEPDESTNQKRRGAVTSSHGSSIEDLFSGGAPVWLKVVGAAVTAPILMFVYVERQAVRNGMNRIHTTSPLVLFSVSAIGAIAGLALSMKDIVHARRDAGLQISWPLQLMYCRGIVSILFVWGPIATFLLIAGMVLLL
jgi:hypothetical protein